MNTIVIFLSVDNGVARQGLPIIANYFEQKGFVVRLVDMLDKDEVLRTLKETDWTDVYFSLGTNGLGCDICLNNGQYLYEIVESPYIALLTDAPYNPYTSKMQYPCNNQAAIYLDETHRYCLNEAYAPKKIKGMFMPWGGCSKVAYDEVLHRRREFNVVYCATYGFEHRRTWHDLPLERPLIKLLDEIADYLETHPESVCAAAELVLRAHGFEDQLFLKRIQPYFKYLFMYIKIYRRLRGLELAVANGIEVDVFGGGWENSPLADKLRLHGVIDYEQTLEVFSRAKIVYQDMAEFNHGGHDRVFSAMLSGAAVVSEYSSYLAREFTDGEEIFFYDWQRGEQQVRVINELLADEQRRLGVALKAYAKADKKHRWENRAASILEFAALLNIK